MKRIVPYFLIVLLLFSGCSEINDTTLEESNSVISYKEYQNIQSDIEIRIINDNITTKTVTIDLEFINDTDQEITYSDEFIILEKKEEGGFISVGSYGNGHEMLTGLNPNATNELSISITPLEVGTYRFAFLQGYSTPDGPVYISPEFQVNK